LESPARFRKWLEAKKPDDIVGNYQTPDETVLAIFLWDARRIYVMTFDFILYEGEHIELPSWCAELVRAEVEHYKIQPPPKADWTAAEALTMLQEVQNRLPGNQE
jgi:hypothetical protein